MEYLAFGHDHPTFRLDCTCPVVLRNNVQIFEEIFTDGTITLYGGLFQGPLANLFRKLEKTPTLPYYPNPSDPGRKRKHILL